MLTGPTPDGQLSVMSLVTSKPKIVEIVARWSKLQPYPSSRSLSLAARTAGKDIRQGTGPISGRGNVKSTVCNAAWAAVRSPSYPNCALWLHIHVPPVETNDIASMDHAPLIGS
jgi:hypothetical protein